MHIDMTHDTTHSPLSSDIHRERRLVQDSAQRMSILAIRQWERAIGGLLAVPSAIACTGAAGAMLVTSVVERAFEVVELTAVDVGRRLGKDHDAHGEPKIGNGTQQQPS